MHVCGGGGCRSLCVLCAAVCSTQRPEVRFLPGLQGSRACSVDFAWPRCLTVNGGLQVSLLSSHAWSSPGQFQFIHPCISGYKGIAEG